MKLITFNVQHCLNYLTKEIDYPRFGQALRELDADVVGINEIYTGADGSRFGNQVARLAELGGYPYTYFAKAISVDPYSFYGNALLSRVPIVQAHSIAVPDPSDDYKKSHPRCETRRLLKAKLENGLWVLCLHMGLTEKEQENALQTVLSHLEPTQCVLMGDFNVTPDHPLIAALNERMTDTAQWFPSPALSFPSDAPDRKIDYLFVSRDLTVKAAEIPAMIVSDHRPHTATISL